MWVCGTPERKHLQKTYNGSGNEAFFVAVPRICKLRVVNTLEFDSRRLHHFLLFSVIRPPRIHSKAISVATSSHFGFVSLGEFPP